MPWKWFLNHRTYFSIFALTKNLFPPEGIYRPTFKLWLWPLMEKRCRQSLSLKWEHKKWSKGQKGLRYYKWAAAEDGNERECVTESIRCLKRAEPNINSFSKCTPSSLTCSGALFLPCDGFEEAFENLLLLLAGRLNSPSKAHWSQGKKRFLLRLVDLGSDSLTFSWGSWNLFLSSHAEVLWNWAFPLCVRYNRPELNTLMKREVRNLASLLALCPAAHTLPSRQWGGGENWEEKGICGLR